MFAIVPRGTSSRPVYACWPAGFMPAGLLASMPGFVCQLPSSQSAALLASANLPASVALSLCGGCWPRCLASLLAGRSAVLLAVCWSFASAAFAMVYRAIADGLSLCLPAFAGLPLVVTLPPCRRSVPPPPFMFTFFFFSTAYL